MPKIRINFEEGMVLRYFNPKFPDKWQPLHVITKGKVCVQRGKKYRSFMPMEDKIRPWREKLFTPIGTVNDVHLIAENPAPENYTPCHW